MSKADRGHSTPETLYARPVSAGPLLSPSILDEGSAAYSARVKAAEITAEIDHFRAREPLAGRLVLAVLIQQLAVDLASVLLAEPDLGRRHAEARQ